MDDKTLSNNRANASHRALVRILLILVGVLACTWLLLLIPEPETPIEQAVNGPVQSQPFAWNQDAFWKTLESEFRKSRVAGCPALQQRIDRLFEKAAGLMHGLSSRKVAAEDSLFREMEELIFQLAPWIAACPSRFADFSTLVMTMRMEAKRQSRHWDMSDRKTCTALYRIMYGGRAAVEEVLLQVPLQDALPALVTGATEPSRTPWVNILGVRIHSGDILLSRGGAATSALIARGNDFAGNFSHIALVYVDPQTRQPSIIESHIERGVVTSNLDDYLRDVKLRILILRPRADLPEMQADPMLPHRAAGAALNRARKEHIPYDFAMDWQDDRKLFCSEVASSAYRSCGLSLWMNLSNISSPGLRRWLAGFGVRHFTTQEPSDLEYDPQLQVIAEWRDLQTLRKDHVDNAVTEALLDGANQGEPLRYDPLMLPVARILKVWSWILNRFGWVGPVPEGMSAAAGLRNRWYTARHAAIKSAVEADAARFEIENGYYPPYWRLVEFAANVENRDRVR